MRRFLPLLLLMSLICLPASATAQDSRFYAGLKLGSMVPDVDGWDSSFDGGVVVAYRLIGELLAAEISYTAGLGEAPAEVAAILGRWRMETAALCLTSRYGREWYWGYRIGVLHETVFLVPADGIDRIRESDTGLTLGLVGGTRVSARGRIELEATVIEQDINFIAISYLFGF